jgi:hypothetical protein
MINPATTSEYVTMAVPTAVAGALKVETIASIETCIEAMLKTIRIWARAMMTIGSHDAFG